MMKRVLSVLLVIAIVAIQLPFVVTAEEAATGKMTTSASEITVKDTVDISFVLENNSKTVGSMQFAIFYDQEAFEYVDSTLSTDYFESFKPNVMNDGTIRLAQYGGTSNAKTGKLVTLRFKPTSKAVVGKTYDFGVGSKGVTTLYVSSEASTVDGDILAFSASTTGSIMTKTQVTIKASYKIKYTDGTDNQSIFPTEEYEVMEGKPVPEFQGSTDRAGFVFDGWDPTPGQTATGDVTFKPLWAVNVKFVVDGQTTKSVKVRVGEKVTKPEVPYKATYGFAGWYLDSTYTQKFDFNTKITQETTLYARFFKWGDVDMNGAVTANDANLISQYVMEVDNKNIKNILAGRVSSIKGTATTNDANYIARYVMEAIDDFPVSELCKGYEYDIENGKIIPPAN